MNERNPAMGPELALAELSWVQGLARRLVRDPHDAEEIAQETWLAALRAKGSTRSRAWMAGVVRNLARRRLRGQKPRAAGLLEDVHAGGSSPDEMLARARFQRQVLDAVTGLDDPYRTTVLLRYFEGLPVEELSRRMGVPASTARTRLARAHARLREQLDTEYGERRAWALLAGFESAPLALVEVGIMGTQLKVGVALVTACCAGLFVWKSLAEPPLREPGEGEVLVVVPERVEAQDDGSARRTAGEPMAEVFERAPTETDVEVASTNPEAADGALDASAQIEAFRRALEESVIGRLDAKAVLELALLLTELEFDDRAVPELDVTGRLRFAVLETPEGIETELTVSRSNVPKYAHVLGLDVKLTDPGEGPVIDGIPRGDMWASVQVWGGRDEELLHLSIMTHLEPNYRLVPGLESAKVTEGVHYYLDLADPLNTKLSGFGIENGQPANWELPLALDGGVPERASIDRLGRGLIRKYAEIRGAPK